MKKRPALIASFLITLAIALPMFFIGLNAFTNKNVVSASTTTSSMSANLVNSSSFTVSSSGSDQQIAKLQQQLDHANQQIQDYQKIMLQLEQLGLVNVSQNGQITVPGISASVVTH